jgi:fucose permease
MALYAWASVLAGANLPGIVSTFRLNSALAGLLVAFPAVGFIAAGFVGGFLSRWIGLQSLLALSASGLALGLFLAAGSTTAPLFILAALLIGLSGGMLQTGSNGLVADLNPENEARELNRLHIFFGAGAFVSPLVVAVSLACGMTWRASYGLTGFMDCIVALLLALQLKPSGLRLNPVQVREFAQLARRQSVARAWGGAFLYAACELGFSNWIVTYLHQQGRFSLAFASVALSSFWLAMLVGRICNTRLPHIPKDQWVIALEALGSSACLALALSASSVILSFLGLVLAGIFMGGILPSLLGYATRRNPGLAGPVSGFIHAGVGAGMLVGPSLVGVLAQSAGLTRTLAGMITLVLALSLMFALPERGEGGASLPRA